MDSLQPAPDDRALVRLSTRARVVVRTTKREFAYRWTAPRTPAHRVLAAPLVIVAGLIALLVGLLLLAAMLAAALVVVVVSFLSLFLGSRASRR